MFYKRIKLNRQVHNPTINKYNFISMIKFEQVTSNHASSTNYTSHTFWCFRALFSAHYKHFICAESNKSTQMKRKQREMASRLRVGTQLHLSCET